MKTIVSTVLLTCMSILTFAQSATSSRSTKTTTAGKTGTAAKKTTATANPVPPPPPKVLTPAEWRQRNTMTAVEILYSSADFMTTACPAFINCLQDRSPYLSYSVNSDTSAQVIARNYLNQTENLLDVIFDSTRISRIEQYKPIKVNYIDVDNNAKWTRKKVHTFYFQYDSTGRISSIGRVDHGHSPKIKDWFNYFYTQNKLDSIQHKTSKATRTGIDVVNARSVTDSIYVYDFDTRTHLPLVQTRILYSSPTRDCIQEQVSGPDGGITFLGKVYVSPKNKISRTQVTFINGSIASSVHLYGYDTAGMLQTATIYDNVGMRNLSQSVDSLMAPLPPIKVAYTLNATGQVTKQLATYRSRCLDYDETTLYTLDGQGFVTETKTQRDTRSKCDIRY